MECPLDYSLCDKTVTLYRKQGDQVFRQVVDGCSYVWQQEQTAGEYGIRKHTSFSLIIPGDKTPVYPGDRVLEGVGPEQVDWTAFIPEAVWGLGEVAYVKNICWNGKVCHVEAGRR